MVIFVGQVGLTGGEYRKRRKLKFFKGFVKILEKVSKKLDGKRVVA